MFRVKLLKAFKTRTQEKPDDVITVTCTLAASLTPPGRWSNTVMVSTLSAVLIVTGELEDRSARPGAAIKMSYLPACLRLNWNVTDFDAVTQRSALIGKRIE